MLRRLALAETVYETSRLRLEPLGVKHADVLFSVFRDSRLYRFIPHAPPRNVGALRERIKRLESRRSPSGEEIWLNWVVTDKVAGTCLGRVEATLLPDGSALLAYEIGAEHWQRGYATEACRRIVEALFSDFAAERVEAQVDSRNVASMNLLTRLGFVRGPLRMDADHFKGSASHEYTFRLCPPQGGPSASPGSR